LRSNGDSRRRRERFKPLIRIPVQVGEPALCRAIDVIGEKRILFEVEDLNRLDSSIAMARNKVAKRLSFFMIL